MKVEECIAIQYFNVTSIRVCTAGLPEHGNGGYVRIIDPAGVLEACSRWDGARAAVLCAKKNRERRVWLFFRAWELSLEPTITNGCGERGRGCSSGLEGFSPTSHSWRASIQGPFSAVHGPPKPRQPHDLSVQGQ